MTEDVAELERLLRQLRAADPTFRVFGSDRHRYRLGACASEVELAAFEAAHGVPIPEDYRHFLSTVGNGGAGPYYGLEPLRAFDLKLLEAFPFTTSTEPLPDGELDRILGSGDVPGTLELCHQGCAIHSYLVVRGPTSGTIWDGQEQFYPTGLTFAEWYRRWLNRALRTLRNDPLVARLRVGMTRADVISEVGGEWVARPATGRAVRYFESSEIPAQLELDEADVVVKVSPWASITARPWPE